MGQTECRKDNSCEEKALKTQAREAAVAEASAKISLGQLALSFAGLGAVGLTIFYARLAWTASRDALADARADAEEQARRYNDRIKWEHENTVHELRAYVMVTLKGASMPANKLGEANIEIRNRGQTPAHNLIVLWAVFVCAEATPENIDESDAKAGNPDDSRMLLGPGEHRGAKVSVKPFDALEIASVRDGINTLWVVGRVEYTDAFNNRRHTRFCHRYIGLDISSDGGTYGHYGNSYT